MVKHTIIYAEDDLDDIHVFNIAFAKYRDIEILHFFNGWELLSYINALPQGHAIPCLILLDINMPGMDGKETLVRLKKNKNVSFIPTVLLTTSSTQADKDFALKWDADFITKPLVYTDLEKFVDRLAALCQYKKSVDDPSLNQ
jgi:DNA-binding response OmpR family regulator